MAPNTYLRLGYILLEFVECLAVVRFTTGAQLDCGVARLCMELGERVECLLEDENISHVTVVAFG